MIKKISVNNYQPYLQNKKSSFNNNKIKQKEMNITFCGANSANMKTSLIRLGMATIPGSFVISGIILFLGTSKKLASTQIARFLNNSESYKILKNDAGKILKFINIF